MTNISELISKSGNNISYLNVSDYNDYDFVKVLRNYNITNIVLSLSGVILNISMISLLLLLKGPLKTHLKFVLSLATSDLLIALWHFASLFYHFAIGLKPSTASSFIFKTLLSLYLIGQYAGLGTMLAISVDILIKIRRPLRYKILMSKMRGNIVIICLWFVTPATFIFISVCFRAFMLGNSIDSVDLSAALLLASGLFFALCSLLFIVFIILYTVIICSIRNFANRYSSRRRTSIKKAAVTFLFVLLTYFVCLMPMIWLLLPLLTSRVSHPLLAGGIASSLYIVNTICDPIIYTLRIPEIKEKYWTIYRKMCHRGQSESAV